MFGVLFHFFSYQYFLYLFSSLFCFISSLFSLEFFHATLLCGKTATMEHLSFDIYVCEKQEVTVGNKVLLSWMKNCNFLFQNLQSGTILTLKFLLTPWAIFIQQSSIVEGQKTTMHPNLHSHLACNSHLHLPRSSLCHLWRHPFPGAVQHLSTYTHQVENLQMHPVEERGLCNYLSLHWRT